MSWKFLLGFGIAIVLYLVVVFAWYFVKKILKKRKDKHDSNKDN